MLPAIESTFEPPVVTTLVTVVRMDFTTIQLSWQSGCWNQDQDQNVRGTVLQVGQLRS